MVEDWIAKGDNEAPPEALPDRWPVFEYARRYYATTLSLVENKAAAAAGLEHVKFYIEANCNIPPTASHLSCTSAAVDYICVFDLVDIHDSPTNLLQFDDNTFAASPRRIASSWIDECLSSHALCLKAGSVDSGWLPTRLIDVGRQGEIQNVRLVTTASEPTLLGSFARYATLSHCWGTASFLTLTKSRFGDLSRGIPLANLPRTFQEAITVCHHLSIGYIWIDSLCIIQDDVDDWLSESVRMESVYANGFINIAASISQESSQGLFRRRDPSQSPVRHPLEVDFEGTNGADCEETTEYEEQQESKQKGRQLHKCLIVSREEWMSDVEQSTLAMRGWVLQERLLSPRILIFGNRQIYWQCFQTLRSEEGTPMLRPIYDKDIKIPFGRALKDHHDYQGEDGTKRLLALWNQIVSIYCRAQLTKPTDRLVALSGLAKAFSQKLPQDKYLAGMWQSNLRLDLLWKCNYYFEYYSLAATPSSSSSPSLQQTEYCAPTFCWASASLPNDIETVSISENPIVFCFTVLDLQLTHKTEDTTGPVTSGYLDIQAKLIRVVLSFTGASTTSIRGPGIVPVNINFGLDRDGNPVSPLGEIYAQFDRAIDLHNDDELVVYFFVAAVDVYFDSSDETEDSGGRSWVALGATCMLLEVVDMESGIYRRIGMADRLETFLKYKGDDLENPEHGLLKARGLPDAPIPNRGRSGEEYIFRII
ncbi:hypothetical protein MCOR25_006115 [Pyricularia grisea]|nr:hypothetical protein MCOR25_006115 [Pyricularia grisea]